MLTTFLLGEKRGKWPKKYLGMLSAGKQAYVKNQECLTT